MDSRAYVDKVTGRTLANIDGRTYVVYINAGLKIGERIFRHQQVALGLASIEVRHTDDLVWDLVWDNFKMSERVKAHRHLRNKAIEVRIALFGSPILSHINLYTPLPFDNVTYNFTG